MHLKVPLFAAQLRVIHAKHRELLIRAEPRSGASYALRALALYRAMETEGARVMLVSPSSEHLRRDHIDSDPGLWQMTNPLLAEGASFPQGGGGLRLPWRRSSLAAATWADAVSSPPHVVLVDEADDMGAAAYRQLRERILAKPIASDGSGTLRLAIVVRNRDGWADRLWTEAQERDQQGYGIVDLAAADLPENLRSRPVASIGATQRVPYRDFVESVIPGWRWSYPTEKLAEAMQGVLDRQILRLLVVMPPRYRKSLTVSRLGTACELYNNPWSNVVIGTAGERLARVLSADAQEFFIAAGGAVRRDAKSVTQWRTAQGGSMVAIGVGSSAFGFGWNLGVIDDPFGSWEDAIRIREQERVENWAFKTFMTREDKPLASHGDRKPAMVVIQHRLASKDLAGRIIAREEETPNESWSVVHLQAIRHALSFSYPDHWEHTRDVRPVGEPLDTGIHTIAQLETIRRRDPSYFEAIYQGDPPEEASGGIFDKEYFVPVGDLDVIRDPVTALREVLRLQDYAEEEISQEIAALPSLDTAYGLARWLERIGEEHGGLPRLQWIARGWDFSASSTGDATASTLGALMPATEDGLPRVVWLDVTEDHPSADEVETLVAGNALRDPLEVEQVLPKEPATGAVFVASLEKRIAATGRVVTVVSTSGSKRVRATPHAGAVKSGRVYYLRGREWGARLINQHHKFTGEEGGQDDIVDAAAMTWNRIAVGRDGELLWPGKGSKREERSNYDRFPN